MNKSRKFAALIIIIIILIAFRGEANAQDVTDEEIHGLYVPPKKVFTGGVVAGADLAQVNGSYFGGYFKIGLNAGGIVYTQVSKHIGFSMEILYTQKGSRGNIITPTTAFPIIKYGINLNYAEVPVMINYFDKRRSHIGIGVSYSRLVSSNEVLQVDSSNVLKNINLNNSYPFAANNFDFLAGADLHLWKGFFLNIRYQYSIIPIRTDIPPNYAHTTEYNNLWVVRVMYLLN